MRMKWIFEWIVVEIIEGGTNEIVFEERYCDLLFENNQKFLFLKEDSKFEQYSKLVDILV